MKHAPSLATPLLDEARVEFSEDTDFKSFPFSLPIIKNLKDIQFPTQVTFFVGENGAGKSTLLEAIAYKAGFGAEGGSKNIQFKTAGESSYTATHSPILLAYPGATIYSCDSENLSEIAYTDTEHYRVTKQFLDNPSLYLRHLFHDPQD